MHTGVLTFEPVSSNEFYWRTILRREIAWNKYKNKPETLFKNKPRSYKILQGTSARNYRPSFRENKPRTLVLHDWKRAFWACFRENWVYKFGHWSTSRLKYSPQVDIFCILQTTLEWVIRSCVRVSMCNKSIFLLTLGTSKNLPTMNTQMTIGFIVTRNTVRRRMRPFLEDDFSFSSVILNKEKDLYRRQSARLFLQSSELGPPPTHPQASVSPPSLVGGGGTNSLAERGWGSQFGRGERHCGTLGK